MQVDHLEIDKTRIIVSPADIISLLGDEQGGIDSHTNKLIHTCITNCIKIMSPKAGHAGVKAIETDSREDILIEGTRFKTGKIIRNMLREAEEYLFFAVTAGPEPESLAKELMEAGDYLEGYIVDLIGSAIVESVANQVHRHIRDLAASRGMKVTNRYSPGYCSWDVSEQQKLFRLLPEGCCGIALSDSSLMFPIKSISGIVGIGKTVGYKEYTCEICSMKDCIFRRTIPRNKSSSRN